MQPPCTNLQSSITALNLESIESIKPFLFISLAKNNPTSELHLSQGKKMLCREEREREKSFKALCWIPLFVYQSVQNSIYWGKLICNLYILTQFAQHSWNIIHSCVFGTALDANMKEIPLIHCSTFRLPINVPQIHVFVHLHNQDLNSYLFLHKQACLESLSLSWLSIYMLLNNLKSWPGNQILVHTCCSCTW